MESVNILAFILDDQPSELALIKKKLDEAKLVEYKLFTSETDMISEIGDQVHLTLIDYILGGEKTGLDVLKLVGKKNPLCYNIVVSGHSDANTVIEFFRSGASDFVLKNTDDYLDEIIRSIERALPTIHDRIKFFNRWKPQTQL